jgi:hypothetical protein
LIGLQPDPNRCLLVECPLIHHRHLNDNVGWTKAAIDSALERGSLAD